MSNKTLCPGCDGYSSSITAAVNDGDPCPFCGLPATVILAVEEARKKGADEALIERAVTATQRLVEQQAEVEAARRLVTDLRLALSHYDAAIEESK